MLRIVSGVLFKGCSTSLLCAEEKLEYYKRLGFKEIEYHVCHEFVRECCQREGFNIGGTNSVNLYPLELKGSLQFSEIGNIFRMVTRWCESIPKFELVINPQTVSQKFSRESTKITKDYWVGFQQAKPMTKIGMHDLSDYFDYWKGRTKNKYSKFFMFMARQMSVMLIFTSDHERCETSYFQAQCKLCGLSSKIAVPREDSDVSSNLHPF